MKIVRPVTHPSICKFKDIPVWTIFDASDGLYRKLDKGQVYHLGSLAVSTIAGEYVIWNYIPYPNATLILEPESDAVSQRK